MKRWQNTKRKRDLNWAQALTWQMMLPQETPRMTVGEYAKSVFERMG